MGKGLVKGALANADAIGAETIQVFVGNPRGWAPRPATRRSTRRSGPPARRPGMRVFIHTPYLVNLGSPTPSTYERSVATVAHNLKRAVEIGAEGVVVHTGSCVDEGTLDAAMRQVREGLLPVLDALGDGRARGCCSSRPPARAARCAPGSRTSSPTSTRSTAHPGVGICLDTCHVFAAGAPLDEPGGTTATVDRLVEIAGAGRLRLVHANDSMDVRGAFKDRHQSIGDGYIGLGAFEELFAHPATDGRAVRPGDARLPRRRRPADRAAAEAPRDGERGPDRRTTLLATLALLAITACWGSTFFLIKDLLDRMPVLDFLAVRFAIASVALLLLAPARAAAGSRRDVAAARGGARPAVRRRADPADRRPGAHPGQRVRLHHRHVRRRARRCSPRVLLRTRISARDLGRRRARAGRPRRC